jgi:hypothetical protein
MQCHFGYHCKSELGHQTTQKSTTKRFNQRAARAAAAAAMYSASMVDTATFGCRTLRHDTVPVPNWKIYAVVGGYPHPQQNLRRKNHAPSDFDHPATVPSPECLSHTSTPF